MPYKQTDAWHRQMRDYLMEKKNTIAPRTWQQYRRYLEASGKALGYPNPSSVTLRALQEYEAGLTSSTNTKRDYCSVLKTFLEWTGDRDARKWRPIATYRPKADGVFLREHQVEAVRQVARQKGVMIELLYSLAVDNGCRMVDAQRLTVQNAREMLASGRSMIRSKGRGGGKMRLLVLNQQTFEPLARYLRERDQEGELLFGGRAYVTLWRYLTWLSEISGVDFEPHDLRRTFGNRHWRAGTPIETIAKLLGHESIGMSFKAYIGVDADDMMEAQRKLAQSASSHPESVASPQRAGDCPG